jgi:hypothetical protein
MNGENTSQLPKYRSHKEVWALKIKDIKIVEGVTILYPEETGYKAFAVSAEYVEKHEPKVGGYFVRYENGHESFSPAEPFEAGNTLIDVVKRSDADMVSVPRGLLKRLTTWQACMSYNDSYFSEPAGELKRVTGEIGRLL